MDEGGKECVAGNYMPAWCNSVGSTYKVQGKWPEALWKHYKLDDVTYEQYISSPGMAFKPASGT